MRRDLVNTFYYQGKITKVTQPTQVVINGKPQIIRSITIVWTDFANRYSKIVMSIPSSFNHARLEKMIELKVYARFRFCIKHSHKGYYFMCMSVEPHSKRYAHLRQEVYCDPYIIDKDFYEEKKQIDEDGYLYPYDY